MALWVTYCSKDKNNITEGSPAKLYRSRRISSFIEFCEGNGLRWAVLSAKYDLFLPNEEHGPYDVTFKTDPKSGECLVVENARPLSIIESKKWIENIAERIAYKIKQHNIRELIFYAGKPCWNESPEDRFRRVKCYLKVLHAGADGCEVNHLKWFELVACIGKQLRSGKGVIRLTTELKL